MTIHLIRHAQSEFNAVYDPNRPDPMIYDAPLTELGKSQAIAAREGVAGLGIEKIIVSPFTRTLQTAEIIFQRLLPTKVNALVREQLTNSCDVGKEPAVLEALHEHLDFSHLPKIWWHQGQNNELGYSVEPIALLERRAAAFRALVRSSAMHSTAIVTHGNFIRAVTGVQPDNCQIVKLED